MQVSGQNVQPKTSPQVQQPVVSQCYCTNPQQPVQTQTPQTVTTYPAGYMPVQNTVYPQYQPTQIQPQTVQVPPSTSGVNIQIFNPSVGTPGGAPTYNVNAPCYPSGYYTSSVGPDGKLYPNTSGGQQGNNTNNGSIDGNVNTGTNNGTIGNGNNSNNTNITNSTVNTETTDNKKKTEKRKIIQLTDDYIRNLENYLNSQDKSVRLNAAKEVYARLQEDDSRADDKALTALINKMLQDPSIDVRFLALSALDGRICKGDDYTAGVLQRIQSNSNDPLNQEAVDASNILLKMSGKQVEKEFEVKETPKKKTTETKTVTQESKA
ncbi:hypothetical protein IJ541_07550 [bacterium]|nr:hypothetical protein [bacterium]